MKISYSGVRGIVGEDLTPAVAAQFGQAFAALVRERHPGVEQPIVIVGRDTRPSGPELQEALLGGMGGGFHFIEVGVAPTPTVQFAMEPVDAHAAIVISASHNPPEWNGFKFLLGPQRTVLDGAQTDSLMALVHAPVATRSGESVREDRRAALFGLHLERVLEQVDVERIRAAHLRVALDPGQGAGEEPALALLDRLGCQVFPVHAKRDSEPLPENLGVLCQAVREHQCQIGLAQDLDADRLALVGEDGRPIGEELTLVLCLEVLLGRTYEKQPTVVRNIATTRLVDRMAVAAGARIVETRVGEVNLSRALARIRRAGNPSFGGEGSGGVILPQVGLGRDSLVGIALALEWLAGGRAITDWVRELPQLPMEKRKLPLDDPSQLESIFARVRATFPEAHPDDLDGLRLLWPDGSWLLLRPSNTEPILRAVGQSEDPAWLEQTFARLLLTSPLNP